MTADVRDEPDAPEAEGMRRSRAGRFKQTMRGLYYGDTAAARRFRFMLLTFDVVAITYFVVSTVTETAHATQPVDFVIGVVLLTDLAMRLWISPSPWRQVRQFRFWVDVVVIVALFGSAFVQDLDFLRILRILRVLRSYRLLHELRKDFPWFKHRAEVVDSALNLLVFIFVTTALVFIVEVPDNPDITSFLDALYFTIATLTTTGFGDITPVGSAGRLLSIAIMVIGVGLFIRLLQAVFRPDKVNFVCPRCGLERHDHDAIHCKHCGEIVNIPAEGAV